MTGGVEERQLELAIQLSLQSDSVTPAVCSACVASLNAAPLTSTAHHGGPQPTSAYQYERPSTVDITVDYFLKSLARCDLQSFESSEQESEDTPCFQPTSEMEDGRFEIGELHENGGRFAAQDEESLRSMRRSHSTGDLCTRPTPAPSCAYFDSDHSGHEERPEELARRNLRQAASAEEERSELGCELGYVQNYAQSSLEDTSDSLNADLEVCGILGVTDDDSSEQRELPPPKPKPKPVALSTPTTPNSSLRIRICKSPKLDTDSSNEYESETGIPKSPTLFISGVSISRTPEPRSPAVVALSGRQSRSSSLTVPVSAASRCASPEPPHSPKSPALLDSPRPSRCLAVPSTPTPSSPTASPTDPATQLLSPGVSKSASEPEREKEMFRFPKSSTDGALSSVLLVQESNLSSDDFHEALFLEKSPKSSKRRKKSKKDRNKENGVECSTKSGNTLSTPVVERRASKESSSVL